MRQRSIRWEWLLGLGVLLGVGLLAKFSIVGGILASGFVLVVLAWRQHDRRLRTLFIYSAWTAGGLLLIAGWYIARNWLLYGDPSGVLVMAKYNVNPMRPYATVGSFWQMLTTRRPGFVDLWPGLISRFLGYLRLLHHLDGAAPVLLPRCTPGRGTRRHRHMGDARLVAACRGIGARAIDTNDRLLHYYIDHAGPDLELLLPHRPPAPRALPSDRRWCRLRSPL